MKNIFNLEILKVLFICIIVAIMDITGIPAFYFIDITFLDINPLIISLFSNFILIAIFIFLSKKFLFPSWNFSFNKNYLLTAIKDYGIVILFIFVATTFAFYIGLKPFDYNPSIYKVLIEGIIYYIGVGFIEELYIRGLLLNALEIIFKKKNNFTLLSIIFSSVIFGIGHIFGSLESPLIVIISKVIWTISLGLFLGVIYKKSNCLLISIIAHSLIDFSAIPFVFKKEFFYPTISLMIIIPLYLALGIFSIYIYKRK